MKTAEDIIKDNKRQMIRIFGSSSVFEAVRLMMKHQIGALVVKEGNSSVGIFSERDLLRHAADSDFNIKTAMVSDCMSTPLPTTSYDTPIIKLKEMFLGLYIRHIVIEKEGRQIGLLSVGDVLRATLLEQDKRMKELNTMVSWEYYENWGWDRKKRK